MNCLQFNTPTNEKPVHRTKETVKTMTCVNFIKLTKEKQCTKTVHVKRRPYATWTTMTCLRFITLERKVKIDSYVKQTTLSQKFKE